jgi:hypothetical protein
MPKKLFEPGQSGNIHGRPKDKESFSGILRELLNQQKVEFTLINKDGKEKHFYAEAPEGKTIKQVLMAMQVSKALAGNDKAIDRVMERIEGKVAQSVKLELPRGKNGKIDLSKLQKPEIEQLKVLLKKAHGDKE